MAHTIPVEDERGTYVRAVAHPHNGYYAGDFRATRRNDPAFALDALRTLITATIR